MKEDLSISNSIIPKQVKTQVYKDLLFESGLLEDKEEVYNKVKSQLINIYKKFIYPKDLLERFYKSKRVASINDVITVNMPKLFNTNSSYYPNDVLKSRLVANNSDKLYSPIFMECSFTLCEDEEFPCYNCYNKKFSNNLLDYLDIIDPSILLSLKDSLLNLFELDFKIGNFRIDNTLLDNCSTFGQLYKTNKKYYVMAYNEYLKIKNDVELEKDISTKLKELKKLLIS